MRRIVIVMGLITALASLLGCAPDLPDQAKWESEVQAAAAAVAPDDVDVQWVLRSTGLTEARHMEIKTTTEGQRVDAEQLGLEIEAAVAPVVVQIPRRSYLRIRIDALTPTGEETAYHAYSIDFDDVAEKYGLTRQK